MTVKSGRLKENNGKEEEEEVGKGKEKEEKSNDEKKKDTCDNKELSLSGRRTSPRKKKGLEMGSQSEEQSPHVANSNQNSLENQDSDPELPPPVPVLPPVVPVTSSNVTGTSKLDLPTDENDPTEEANGVTEPTPTDTPKEQNCENSEEPALASDLFAVGQNAGKCGGRKKLNRISVDRLEVPPTPPRRSSRRRPPSESPSRAPQPSSARSLSPSKSPSKRKARGKARRFEDEEEEDDDEPSALHPAQLPLPIEESPPLASDKSSLPVPLQLVPPKAEQFPAQDESVKCEKATKPLKISLAPGFSALAEKVGTQPAPVQHLDDLEPYVESEEEKEKRERKRMEDKQFLEEEKRRLEEEKKILAQKVLEKKKREEEKEIKTQGNEQAEIAPARKGAADFFDMIIKEASEELREADAETALGGSAKDDTRTVKIVDGCIDAEEVEGGEKVQVTEQRRIKRISLNKEEVVELQCALCTPEKKCSVCELQKPPSRPSSRAEKVLRQERWRREKSGEREDESRQMRREEREVRRREKRQRSKEMSSERSSSYLSDLMKEGRMRCDEEGSSGRVTRMDGRIRIQDKVAADKRKDNK